MRPGVDIISRAEPLPRSAPTDTGVCFMCGATATGPATPYLVRSLGQYADVYGDRAGGQVLYDAAETYFREGGAQLWVSALPALVTTPQQLSIGLFSADDLEGKTRAELDSLAVEAGLDPADYATKADVIDALTPHSGTQSVSAGTQAVTPPATMLTLLDLFGKNLGPGQVVMPGLVDTASQLTVLAHCAARNRVAVLDADPAHVTASAIIAQATTLGADANARYGALFAPQAIVPGVAGGTVRTVPYSAVVAGQCARSDALYPANVAAAGVNGQSLFAIDIDQKFVDADYASLNTGGVDMAKLVYGGVRTYGWRSLAVPNTPAEEWLSFGYARLNMEITAQAEAIGERYVFSQIDGRRRTISQFGGDLRAMLLPMWDAGALYGDTSEDAFQVDVGTAVNTEATIANGELHAVLMVKMSPFAEWVVIEIVKVATTEALAA